MRATIRRMIQESATSFDFAPRLHSEVFSIMKLWHSQETSRDRNLRNFREIWQWMEVAKSAISVLEIVFMLTHIHANTQRIMKAKKK